MRLSNKSKYSFKIKSGYLLIVDEMSLNDALMSVTNNIENVLEEIAEDFLISKLKIAYRDTSFNWDEVSAKMYNGRVSRVEFITNSLDHDTYQEMYFKNE